MDNQQTCGRTCHQHMQEHVTAHVTKALLLHPIPQSEAQTETVVYHGKMRYWNESNGEITMGTNREAQLPSRRWSEARSCGMGKFGKTKRPWESVHVGAQQS